MKLNSKSVKTLVVRHELMKITGENMRNVLSHWNGRGIFKGNLNPQKKKNRQMELKQIENLLHNERNNHHNKETPRDSKKEYLYTADIQGINIHNI